MQYNLFVKIENKHYLCSSKNYKKMNILIEDKEIKKIVFVNGYFLICTDNDKFFKIKKNTDCGSFFIDNDVELSRVVLRNLTGTIEYVNQVPALDFAENQVFYVAYK